jgi:hypothetical protein
MSTNPTGNLALATTSTPPDARPPRRVNSSPFPSRQSPQSTGTLAPSPTSAPPGARPERRERMSTHSTGSLAPAPIAAPPGAHPQRRVHRCPHPTGSRVPAPTSAPPAARPWREFRTWPHFAKGSRSPRPRRMSTGTHKTARCRPAARLRCRRRAAGPIAAPRLGSRPPCGRAARGRGGPGARAPPSGRGQGSPRPARGFGRARTVAPLGRHRPRPRPRHRWRRQRIALRRSEEPGEKPGVVPRAVPGQRMFGRPVAGERREMPHNPTTKRDRSSASPRPQRSRAPSAVRACTAAPLASSGIHCCRAVEPSEE